MDDNNYLDEQRRQREELINLKKMKNGVIEPPAVGETTEVLPLKGKKKLENFWYYYKGFVIAGIAIVLVLTLLLTQCAKKVDYDLEIIYFTHEMVLISQLDETTEYFEQYASDVNGDGKVNVLVINCSINPDGDDKVYRNNILTRLQTELCADPKALVFVTDEPGHEYLNNIEADAKLFKSEPHKLNETFYEKTESERYGRLPDGLMINCRELEGTALENYNDSTKYYPYAKDFVDKFIADNAE